MKARKDRTLPVRMSPQDLEQLDQLSETSGLNRCEIIRLLIHNVASIPVSVIWKNQEKGDTP